MALSRRQFIVRGGGITGGLLGTSLFGNPFLRRAFAESIGDRYLVVVNLDGGNDGLNTITPVANGATASLRAAYEAARRAGSGGLRLAPNQLLTTIAPGAPALVDAGSGTPLGFHPGLVGLRNLFDLGKVAVVQGCGYPDHSLSHEQARRFWERAVPESTGIGSGWIGRHLAGHYGGSDIPAVNIRSSVSGDFQQSATSVLTLGRVRDFRFPFDSGFGSDVEFKRTALLALSEEAVASGNAALAYVGASDRATLLASASYPPLHDLYENDRSAFDRVYDDLDTSTARDLREVAKVIYGVESGVPNVAARFFEVRNGGYDTHSDQGAGEPDGQHTRLHREVGDALEAFYHDCADMGVADRLCIVMWSEFSRRIEQNDNGTDHGTHGPAFVIGGAVNGGIYGNHPDIGTLDSKGNTIYSQNDADSFRSTDFRDVFGTILRHWLNLADPEIIFPRDDWGDPNRYWEVPDFDLPFLP